MKPNNQRDVQKAIDAIRKLEPSSMRDFHAQIIDRVFYDTNLRQTKELQDYLNENRREKQQFKDSVDNAVSYLLNLVSILDRMDDIVRFAKMNNGETMDLKEVLAYIRTGNGELVEHLDEKAEQFKVKSSAQADSISDVRIDSLIRTIKDYKPECSWESGYWKFREICSSSKMPGKELKRYEAEKVERKAKFDEAVDALTLFRDVLTRMSAVQHFFDPEHKIRKEDVIKFILKGEGLDIPLPETDITINEKRRQKNVKQKKSLTRNRKK